MEKVDLRFYPYRGVLKKLADELGRDVGSVHRSLFKGKSPDPEIARRFNEIIEERRATVKKFKTQVRKAV